MTGGKLNILNYVLRIFQLATCSQPTNAVREIQALKLLCQLQYGIPFVWFFARDWYGFSTAESPKRTNKLQRKFLDNNNFKFQTTLYITAAFLVEEIQLQPQTLQKWWRRARRDCSRYCQAPGNEPPRTSACLLRPIAKERNVKKKASGVDDRPRN